MRQTIVLVLAILLLAACTAVQKPAQNTTPQQTVPSVQEPKPNSTPTVSEAPKEDIIKIASTPTTLFNDKKQKFQFRSYTMELLFVAEDGSGCQIKINGQSNWYAKEDEVPFDETLKVRVLNAYPTHGYQGDSCYVAFIG